MDPKELVEMALRVLRCWTYGERLPVADIEILRQNVAPEEADLPVDDLACLIVSRECSRVIADLKRDRKTVGRANKSRTSQRHRVG